MIKRMREYRNLTQQDVADKLFSSAQYISNIESGRATLSIDRMAEIASILQCYLDVNLTPVD